MNTLKSRPLKYELLEKQQAYNKISGSFNDFIRDYSKITYGIITEKSSKQTVFDLRQPAE